MTSRFWPVQIEKKELPFTDGKAMEQAGLGEDQKFILGYVELKMPVSWIHV